MPDATTTAEPVFVDADRYEAKLCPVCDVWIYTAGGPFAENDPTKPIAYGNHYEAEHASSAEREGQVGRVIGYPYAAFNEEPVKALVVPARPGDPVVVTAAAIASYFGQMPATMAVGVDDFFIAVQQITGA